MTHEPEGKAAHLRLSKADRGPVKACVEKVPGFSRTQVTRLIGRYQETLAAR